MTRRLLDGSSLPILAMIVGTLRTGTAGPAAGLPAMTHAIRAGLTTLGVWTAHPAAFLVLAAYLAAWHLADPHAFGWHEGIVVATFCMTLLIQRAEHRDTQALHAKLDELLRAHGEARTELARLDEKEPEEIERYRGEARAGAG